MAYTWTSPQTGTTFVSGNTWRKFVGYLQVDVSATSSTTCAVTISHAAGMTNAYGYQTSVTTRFGSSSGTIVLGTTTGSLSSNPGSGWAYYCKASKTYSVNRTSSAQTLTYYISVTVNGVTSTGSLSVTIPAIGSRSVYYDANGGTGAPDTQTALTGTDITLSSTTPSRTGYVFQNWNTTMAGSGDSYAPSGLYESNESVILYAQWAPATGMPMLDNLDVHRASNASGDSDAEGEYLYITGTVNWGAATIGNPGTQGSISVKTKETGAEGNYTEQTGVSFSGSTFTLSKNGFDSSKNYDILLGVTNAQGVVGETLTFRIIKSGYIIRVAEDGSSIAFGAPSQQVLAAGDDPVTVADFVVEQGSSTPTGIVWTWTKWASGKLEIWGTQTLSSTAISTAVGGNYYNSSIKSFGNWPVAFTSTPHTPFLSAVNGKSIGSLALPVSWSATAAPSYYLWSVASVASTSIYVSVHACGRWK